MHAEQPPTGGFKGVTLAATGGRLQPDRHIVATNATFVVLTWTYAALCRYAPEADPKRAPAAPGSVR
jgi:hypothetical protein